jgi:hypothetical protein
MQSILFSGENKVEEDFYVLNEGSIPGEDQLWEMMYQKVSESIEKKQDFAFLLFSESGKNPKSFSIVLTKDQYEIILENFLQKSEELEKFELCSEINKKIKELQSWKEKN